MRTISMCSQLWLVIAIFMACVTAQASEHDDDYSDSSFWYLSGFGEARVGSRTGTDEFEKDESISEARLQLRAEGNSDLFSMVASADFLYDPVAYDHDHGLDLQTGHGVVDLREAHLGFSPVSALDLKIGRQIITWGTGDLLFINDLFPKDFTSFFIGRDPEYLKAPSDALKLSAYLGDTSIDIVYTPRFDADRYVDGSRLSYYNSSLGRLAGRDAIVTVIKPNDWFHDDEVAARIYRNINGVELAIYGYKGFWKSPAGSDGGNKAIFPELNVYGVSAVSSIGKGIANIEAGYYDSIDDEDGDNPLVKNSELRLIVGYKQEIMRNLNIGVQYYLEHIIDHDEYVISLAAGVPERDEYRHLVTLRLTQLLLSQNLDLSIFSFYSPSDKDGYLKASSGYKINDQLRIEIGGNVFYGEEEYTEFGQLVDNSNVYGAIRYSY